jgi:phosphoribosylamine--glycine ligase
MNVLVIGSGGREHALCHALAKSPRLTRLFILPGNAGTARLGTNLPGDASDVDAALAAARRHAIDLTIVGPEDPLAAGLVDRMQAAGLKAFGPTAAGARLEADKAYAKQLMRQYAVPTADARQFTDFELAREYIATRDEPVVVKATGLAKGKGVLVCHDPADAILAAEDVLVKRVFGEAGREILVEERLLGREASLLAIVDGHTALLLEAAQDHKRLRDGDQGPNTGGMGAFCPSPLLDADALRVIQQQILVPTLDALVREGIDYRGVLYLGLMFTTAGPKVLEFNCRFGDPETQAILPRLRSDLLEILDAAASARLAEVQVEWDPRPSLCVVLASAGYPDKPVGGGPISGLPDDADDLVVFHAGTRLVRGQPVASGGRVLGVTALGATLGDARRRAYGAIESIHYEGMQYRTDLGAGESSVPASDA